MSNKMLWGIGAILILTIATVMVSYKTSKHAESAIEPTTKFRLEGATREERRVSALEEAQAMIQKEEVQWGLREFLPTVGRIADDYPVESVREDFGLLVDRLSKDGDVRIEMKIEVGEMTGGMWTFAEALASKPDMQPSIRVYPTRFYHLKRHYDELGKLEAFDDFVIAALMHEQYHLDHHFDHIVTCTGCDTQSDVHVQHEREAYQYEAIEVLGPMALGGRREYITSKAGIVFTTLLISKGDRDHPVWTEFARYQLELESNFQQMWTEYLSEHQN